MSKLYINAVSSISSTDAGNITLSNSEKREKTNAPIDFVLSGIAILFSALYYITENPALMIVLALLLIIGGSVIIFLHLNYGFVFYTLLDYPNASVMQLFRYCGDIMRGHRIKLFYLYASFLPLYALGVISCGIGLFFVIPYQKVSIAQFYLDVFYVNDEESA